MRSACDSEWPTTATHGQSWSLDGCATESVWSAFALVRALETCPKLVVRGRVKLPTSAFQAGRRRGLGRVRSLAGRRSDIGDEDQGVHGARCHVRPGATLGATRTNDLSGFRTAMNTVRDAAEVTD